MIPFKKSSIQHHQFGFRQKHSNKALQNKQYFLDISQAFNKVWHLGLNYDVPSKYLKLRYVKRNPRN